MKIAIVTLTKGANYGNRLQNNVVKCIVSSLICCGDAVVDQYFALHQFSTCVQMQVN